MIHRKEYRFQLPFSSWDKMPGKCLQANDKEFVQQMIAGENIVQMEDIGLCVEVQKGLTSPAYDVGRWASA